VTDFSDVVKILGDLYINYKEDKELADFFEFNDLGMPLAYLASEGLAQPSEDGNKYILETWAIFLAGLNIEDTGFSSLDEVFKSAEGK
jgi:hypothetical protein